MLRPRLNLAELIFACGPVTGMKVGGKVEGKVVNVLLYVLKKIH